VALLRALAVVLALALMVGELWRSWGAERPLMFVIDDQVIGALLLAGAWAMKRDTARRRALFASSWGFSAGMLYPSFFGKLLEPEQTNAGDWDTSVLTILVGLALVIAVVGMIASIALPSASGSAGGELGQQR